MVFFVNLAAVNLPPSQPMSRSGSAASLHSVGSLSGSKILAKESLPPSGRASRGPITGSGRIKEGTRPGSAGSVSSHGSRRSS